MLMLLSNPIEMFAYINCNPHHVLGNLIICAVTKSPCIYCNQILILLNLTCLLSTL